eukprot:COSAG05_NODE_12770_length_455_cov_0.912921_2_plen_99_part_01
MSASFAIYLQECPPPQHVTGCHGLLTSQGGAPYVVNSVCHPFTCELKRSRKGQHTLNRTAEAAQVISGFPAGPSTPFTQTGGEILCRDTTGRHDALYPR